MGFREIERVTGINHNTIIQWAKQSGNTTPESSTSDGLDDNDLSNSSDLYTSIEHQESSNYPWKLFNKYLLKNAFIQFKYKFFQIHLTLKYLKLVLSI